MPIIMQNHLQLINFRVILLLSSFIVGIFSVAFAFRVFSSHASVAVEYACLPSMHSVHVLSYEPLILHIENFLTERERQYLLELA